MTANFDLPHPFKSPGFLRPNSSAIVLGTLCRAGAAILAFVTLAVSLGTTQAQAADETNTNEAETAVTCPVADYFTHWFDRATETQARATPLGHTAGHRHAPFGAGAPL